MHRVRGNDPVRRRRAGRSLFERAAVAIGVAFADVPTRKVTLLVLASLLTVLTPEAARAQNVQTGILEGRVLDEEGTPVSSADVRVSRTDGSHARITVTGEQGTFRVAFLPPGEYEVNVRVLGYRPTRVAGVPVSATEITSLAIELPRAPVELEELRIVTARPVIRTGTTEYTTSLDVEEIERLPISRDATDLINFVPGARPDQLFGGSTSQANSYQIDGVTVNAPGFGGDFLLPNVDWIEEVVVKGLGAGAEYGNFQGGLFNLVTKSGTNTFRGGIRFNFESEDLAASNLNVLEAGDQQESRWEVNGEFRGPIVRDKLYFYVSAQEVQVDTRVVDVLATDENAPAPDDIQFLVGPDGELLLEEREERKLLGKLTWQATEKDILNLLVGKDDVFTDNAGLNSFDSPETAVDQHSPTTFFNASWQRTFSEDHLLEVKVTGWSGENDLEPKHGDRTAVQLLEGNRNAFRNATFDRERTPENLAFAANWDAFLETGSVRHHFKVGGDLQLGSWLERRTRTGGITWRPFLPEGGLEAFDPDDPSTWGFISSDWDGSINLDADVLNGAVYVQDYLEVGNHLTLAPGLRLGFWEGRLDPGDGEESLTALEDVKVAPRIGATLDVFGDATLVVKSHWGRYYQNLFALLFDRTEGADVFERTEFWDWAGEGLPDIDRVYTEEDKEELFEFFGRSSAFLTGPVVDYDQPYVDQFVVGVEKEIVPGWKVGGVYVNRRNHDILSLVDRNRSSNFTELNDISVVDFRADAPVVGPDGEPLVLDRLFISNDDVLFVGEAPGIPPEEAQSLTFERDLALTNVEEADRKFDQVQFSVQREGAGYRVRGSVVWTDLRGNFFSVSGYEAPFGTGSGGFVRPNEQINRFGALPNHSDWEGKLQADGNLPLEFRGGAFLTIRSGDHFTPGYVVDRRNHDFVTADGETLDPDLLFGVDGEVIFLEQRGSREFDAQGILDLHLDRVVALGGFDAIVGLDVFNVFDSEAVVAAKEIVNNQDPENETTLFGAPRFRVAPRQLRLWASFRMP